MEPVFESQTKTKLGSTDMGGGLPTVRTYVNDFIKTYLDNYLHKNAEAAEKIQRKILQAERERKELSGIRKLAKERAKKQTYITKNYVIAEFIFLMLRMIEILRPPYLLPKVTLHLVLLLNLEMLTLKPFLA